MREIGLPELIVIGVVILAALAVVAFVASRAKASGTR
jgi:hypothetical protein